VSVAIISIHDVAPSTFERSRDWVRRVEAHGFRASLLVVPGPWGSDGLEHDPELVAWLHEVAVRGHELSLHGWEHRGVSGLAASGGRDASTGGRLRSAYGRMIARGCGEFHDLDRLEALRRLRLGLGVMARCGIDPVGFTPPGWLSSPESRAAMVELGFAYTTSQWTVFDLLEGREVRIPAVSQRPGSSLSGAGAVMNERVMRHRLRRRQPVRIALHPDDLHHRHLVDATERMLLGLQRASDRGDVDVITYAELVGAWGASRAAVAVS